MTLAIGDGANDVPMIMEAHVGVGISGNEGLQAVRSADYAIAQFRYLNRLLLVHGRNNYIRVSRIILYVFYKNTVCVTALFLYNIYTGWSGTTLFASFLSMSFNFFFTGVPIIVYGFMEQDVKDTTALKNPRLYMPGQRKESFNASVAASWGLNAIVHILLVTFIPIFVMQEANFTDLYVGGTIIMLAQVIGINVRLVLISSHISYISHIVVAVRFSFTHILHVYINICIRYFADTPTPLPPYTYYRIHT
jgi:phospholipid-transporting ATPase